MKTAFACLVTAIVLVFLLTGSGIIERVTDPVRSPTFEVIVLTPFEDEWSVNVWMAQDTSGFRTSENTVMINRIIQ